MRSTPTRSRVAGAALALVLAGTVGASGSGWHGHDKKHHRDDTRAKNVIFIVGDGMGIAHRELIRLATVGRDAELEMDQMPYHGWAHTDPADPEDVVTDSAAGATAFATGVRSYNGAVGVDVDGKPVTSLLERAKKSGKATGLVTTSQVTDATPASFGSHVADRGDQSEIARQFLEVTQPDVILGGGEDWWYPADEEGAWPDNPPTDPSEQSKGTKGNLVERAKTLGYEYVTDADTLAAAKVREGGKLLGLFANEEMFEHHNEGPDAIYDPSVPLPTMATKALDVLKKDKQGFFLVIEEEGIDEMAHHGNATLMIEAGRALDRTVALARDFAKKEGNTLVVVAGDHETGGLAIENPDDDESGDGEQAEDGPITLYGTDQEFYVDWTTGGHTGAATPATAEGPGAARMRDVRDNTDIHDLVLAAMKLDRGRR
ncbi:alkaline phosphatase [Sanguibacter hominis ATCC BAA-789]|uniref:Alkaline phosphatase n=1 Tax=Sanguibacter hominis ATCC BAA-789 TaxID=1312740 RepID=A0A9X5IRI2_9MICO|nr:alkaline phosphatase [Sanguibacter hominis]NKX91926.1 alkaline phosphatase [Sanguibacter hominis ATCC BAA-789]